METTIILGLYGFQGVIGNNGKSNGNYYNIGGYMGIKDKRMEATIVGYIGLVGGVYSGEGQTPKLGLGFRGVVPGDDSLWQHIPSMDVAESLVSRD